MKFHAQLLSIVFTLSLSASTFAFAQTAPTTTPPPAAPKTGGMLSSLTPEEKARLMKAREQVLASDPDLKAEGDDLKKQGEALRSDGADATPEDKMALMQKYQDHQEKMKAAMLKVDPTLAPVIDKLDQAMKARMQARAAQAAGAGN